MPNVYNHGSVLESAFISYMTNMASQVCIYQTCMAKYIEKSSTILYTFMYLELHIVLTKQETCSVCYPLLSIQTQVEIGWVEEIHQCLNLLIIEGPSGKRGKVKIITFEKQRVKDLFNTFMYLVQ